MSLFRGSNSSSERVSGSNSGVYTGSSGSLSINNSLAGTSRLQHVHPVEGFRLETPFPAVMKRPSPDLHYPSARKQQRTDLISTWTISGYSVPSPDLRAPSPSNQQSSSIVSEESVIRSRLQELERELLDDDDQEPGLGSEIVEVGSDWEEAMQSLISSASATSPALASSSSPGSACSATSPANADPKQLLLDSLVALSEGKKDCAIVGIARVRQLCTPRAGDSEHRLLAHIARAIHVGPSPSEVGPPAAIELFSPEHLLSLQLLFESSPCFKLGFMAANLAILDAIAHRSRIHVIDFDIGQGHQYITLIQALAGQRSGKSTFLRITAVLLEAAAPASGLRPVGQRLEKLAERFGIRCTFHVVRLCRVEELNPGRLGCSGGQSEEALAVNFPYRLYRVADESVSTENQRDEMLRSVRRLNPVAVVVVEQVMNGNTSPLVSRFGEVVSHYRAVFDSLDATMTCVGGSDETADARFKLEEFLGRRAANAVACEGRDRFERCEVAGKWVARLEMAGFRPRPLPPHVQSSFVSKLKSYRKPGFTLKEEGGGICFGWNERLLTYASSWH